MGFRETVVHGVRRTARKALGCHVRRLAILLSLLLLTGCHLDNWWQNGCKVGPNYCPPSAPVANHWIETGNANVKIAPAANGAWWKVFNDPVLDQLVDAAARQNLPLRVAVLRICQARAQLGIAQGEQFPQKQQSFAQYTRNGYSRNGYPFGVFPIRLQFDDWQTGFDAAWELDIWGKFRRGVESASAALDAQVAAWGDVLVSLQAEVAVNYIEMRVQEQRIALTRQNAELQAKTLRLVELRYNKGLVTDLDVQRATANLNSTQALIPTFEIEYRRAQNRLCILMGIPPYDMFPRLDPPVPIPVAPPEVVIGIPADLLRRGRTFARPNARRRRSRRRSASPRPNSTRMLPSLARSR